MEEGGVTFGWSAGGGSGQTCKSCKEFRIWAVNGRRSACRLLAVRLYRHSAGRTEEGRYPQGERDGIGGDQRAPARNRWRFGRPDGIEQYQDQIYRAIQQGRLFRPLCLLWHLGLISEERRVGKRRDRTGRT